jgi:hypothetical protein
MKCSKRSFAVVSLLFAVLLLLTIGTLNARDADLASRTFAAAQTAFSSRGDRTEYRVMAVTEFRVRYFAPT